MDGLCGGRARPGHGLCDYELLYIRFLYECAQARAGFCAPADAACTRLGCGQRPDHGLYCRPREPKAWKNAPLSTVYSNPDSHSDDPSVLCAQAVWNTVDGICGGHLCCLGHDLHRIRRAVLESAECDDAGSCGARRDHQQGQNGEWRRLGCANRIFYGPRVYLAKIQPQRHGA